MRRSIPMLHLAPVVTLAMMIPSAAAAATISVDTTTDAIDSSGDCSLREAIIAANTNAAVDGCTAGESTSIDEIVLGTGTYTLTIDGLDEEWEPGEGDPYIAVDTPDATIGDLDIKESVTITGDGSGDTYVEWGGTVDDRVFHIAPESGTTAVVTVTGLTIQYGAVHANVINPEDPEEEQWLARRFGGGMAAGAGIGTKLASASGPSDEGGPSDEEEGGFGDVELTLEDVRFYSNYAGGDAGGLFAGDITASNVVFENNTTEGNGGGAYSEGTLALSGVAFIDNTAEGGGAMFLTGPTTGTFYDTLMSGNYATGGGGLSFRSLVDVDLVNCTIAGNEAFDVGGGLYGNGNANLYNCTIAGNIAGSDASFGGGGLNSFGGGSFNLVNTLLADNLAGAVDANCGCTGGSCDTGDTFTSWGYNLEDADTCGLTESSDLKNTDPLLGTLGDYGGFSATYPFPDGSPAQDAAGADHCPDYDARGVARPIGSACDIGAFELSPLEWDGDIDGYCEGLDFDGVLYCSDGSLPADCDDLQPLSFPGNPEVCDAIDNDCANGVDDGLPFADWYWDADEDGYGDVAISVNTCDGPPEGYVELGTDCDDAEPLSFPGNPEVCDDLDNDCLNGVDDGLLFEDWYLDVDADGFGDLENTVSTCDGAPEGYVADSTDCDDSDDAINPDAIEICNDGVDDDCDALADDADDSVDMTTGTQWYADEDGDGFGNELDALGRCEQPEGYVIDSTDCDDQSDEINPDAEEIKNEIDDDCDGLVDRDDDDYVRACGGCSSGSGAPSGVFAILIGLAAVLRRRRAA